MNSLLTTLRLRPLTGMARGESTCHTINIPVYKKRMSRAWKTASTKKNTHGPVSDHGMTEQALYSTFARYYDRVYHQKDYDDDARRLDAIIEGRKRSPGNRLLDIGCGTGEHILRFSDRYECTGIDLHEEMMEVARRKVPRARFQQMDMRYLELGTTFDVIISMWPWSTTRTMTSRYPG